MNLAPFGRTFGSGVFHGLSVTARTTKNRHDHLSSFEFGITKFEIDDRLINPYLASTMETTVAVFLRRGAKGNIFPLLYQCLCFQLLFRIYQL